MCIVLVQSPETDVLTWLNPFQDKLVVSEIWEPGGKD